MSCRLVGAKLKYDIAVTLVGAWLSLVEHSVRDRGVGGSNPLAPTIRSTPNPVDVRAAAANALGGVSLECVLARADGDVLAAPAGVTRA